MKEESKWIECSCTDADDAMRITYWPEEDWQLDTFYLEMKLHKYPGRWGWSITDTWNHFKEYLLGIKNAILGRNNTYMSTWSGDQKGAKQLADFINKHHRKSNS